MGLRERKHEATRRRLVNAARHLFEEYGYDGTTIEMIADAADVSPRTFHRYFETKAGVASEPARELVARVAAVVRAEWSVLDLIDALGSAIEDSVATGNAWAVRLHLQTPALLLDSFALRQRWAQELADGIAATDGRTESSLDDRVRGTVAVQLAALAVDEWMLRRSSEDLGQVLKDVKDVLPGGLSDW